MDTHETTAYEVIATVTRREAAREPDAEVTRLGYVFRTPEAASHEALVMHARLTERPGAVAVITQVVSDGAAVWQAVWPVMDRAG